MFRFMFAKLNNLYALLQVHNTYGIAQYGEMTKYILCAILMFCEIFINHSH